MVCDLPGKYHSIVFGNYKSGGFIPVHDEKQSIMYSHMRIFYSATGELQL